MTIIREERMEGVIRVLTVCVVRRPSEVIVPALSLSVVICPNLFEVDYRLRRSEVKHPLRTDIVDYILEAYKVLVFIEANKDFRRPNSMENVCIFIRRLAIDFTERLQRNDELQVFN